MGYLEQLDFIPSTLWASISGERAHLKEGVYLFGFFVF